MRLSDGGWRGKESGVGQGRVSEDARKLSQQLGVMVGMQAQEQEQAQCALRQGLNLHSAASILHCTFISLPPA